MKYTYTSKPYSINTYHLEYIYIYIYTYIQIYLYALELLFQFHCINSARSRAQPLRGFKSCSSWKTAPHHPGKFTWLGNDWYDWYWNQWTIGEEWLFTQQAIWVAYFLRNQILHVNLREFPILNVFWCALVGLVDMNCPETFLLISMYDDIDVQVLLWCCWYDLQAKHLPKNIY